MAEIINNVKIFIYTIWRAWSVHVRIFFKTIFIKALFCVVTSGEKSEDSLFITCLTVCEIHHPLSTPLHLCTLIHFCSHHHAFLLLSVLSMLTFLNKSFSVQEPSLETKYLAEILLEPCNCYLPFKSPKSFSCQHPESCLMMFSSTNISVFVHLHLSTDQYEYGSMLTAILFIILCSLVVSNETNNHYELIAGEVSNKKCNSQMHCISVSSVCQNCATLKCSYCPIAALSHTQGRGCNRRSAWKLNFPGGVTVYIKKCPFIGSLFLQSYCINYWTLNHWAFQNYN